jgi:hypothetical protein
MRAPAPPGLRQGEDPLPLPAGDGGTPQAGEPDAGPPCLLVSADSRGGYAVPRQLDGRHTRQRKR